MSKGKRKVVRGGSWRNDQRGAHYTFRDRTVPENFDHTLGFRVVRKGALIQGSER